MRSRLAASPPPVVALSVSLALAWLAVAQIASASPCAEPDAETRNRAEALAERAALLEEAGRHAEAARAFAGSFKLDCSRPELLLAAAKSDTLAATDVPPAPARVPIQRETTQWVRQTAGPGPWVVMALGATMLITSAALIVEGNGHVLESETPLPYPTATSHVSVLEQAASDRISQAALGQVMRTDGILIGGVGFASAIGGLWWYFTEGARHRVRLAPTIGSGGAGASVGADF